MSVKYHLVGKEHNGEDCSDNTLAVERQQPQSWSLSRWRPSWSHVVLAVTVLLLSAKTLLQYSELRHLRGSVQDQSCRSANAQLSRDFPVAWSGGGKWVNDDPVQEAAAWDSPDLDFDEGLVALNDPWAVDHNISLAQRWPWDSQKGIYLLASTHDVHCIKSLRKAILNGLDGKPLSITAGHAKHCLSILMQDTLCNADDSLLYTGAVHANAGKHKFSVGEGQYRMCRDWSQLRQWATSNSACFNKTRDPDLPQTEFYKSCPDGSQPWLKEGSQQ